MADTPEATNPNCGALWVEPVGTLLLARVRGRATQELDISAGRPLVGRMSRHTPRLHAFTLAFVFACGARTEGSSPRQTTTSPEGAANEATRDASAPRFECLREERSAQDACETLRREANCEWNAAFAAVNGCNSDSDCVEFDVASRCFPCITSMVISKSGLETFRSALAELEDGTCDELEGACGLAEVDCGFGTPGAPGCRDGICGRITGSDQTP